MLSTTKNLRFLTKKSLKKFTTMEPSELWWTAWAWAWSAITYKYAQETFSTWSSYDVLWDKIYIKKDATNRFFKYSAVDNAIYPFSTIPYTDWTALIWDKIWTKDGLIEQLILIGYILLWILEQ